MYCLTEVYTCEVYHTHGRWTWVIYIDKRGQYTSHDFSSAKQAMKAADSALRRRGFRFITNRMLVML